MMPTLAGPGDDPSQFDPHLAGDHLIVFGDGRAAIVWRRAGWQVRDTIMVALPGGRYASALVLRRPLEGTVLDCVLNSNTGALNVDACRVESGVKQVTAGRRTVRWGVGQGGSTYEKGTGAKFSTEGRWPTNLLLVHTRTCVPGACDTGCPCPRFDASSGPLRARGNVTPTKREQSNGITGWGVGKAGPIDPGDTGGASRFFAQCHTVKGALAWLRKLLGT